MDILEEATLDLATVVAGILLAENEPQIVEIENLVDTLIEEWGDNIDILLGQAIAHVAQFFCEYCEVLEIPIEQALQEGHLMELLT